jgi:hypothetical protein
MSDQDSFWENIRKKYPGKYEYQIIDGKKQLRYIGNRHKKRDYGNSYKQHDYGNCYQQHDYGEFLPGKTSMRKLLKNELETKDDYERIKSFAEDNIKLDNTPLKNQIFHFRHPQPSDPNGLKLLEDLIVHKHEIEDEKKKKKNYSWSIEYGDFPLLPNNIIDNFANEARFNIYQLPHKTEQEVLNIHNDIIQQKI